MGTSYKELFKLYDFIQSGDSSSLERFLHENAIDTNVIIPCKGIGVLHLAVGIEPLNKSKECTEIILRHGGDPNICNEDGMTPLHIAAIWGRVDNLKLLIGCGGDPAKRDIDGLSTFDYAAREQQWEVFDYLHHVEDVLNDSFESQCGYTLDLERILVTTDQMVAEYEPVSKTNFDCGSSYRKSEMIREWCDKASVVINKLYPTILGETYLIENETVPWKTIDFTKNITLNVTSDLNSHHNEINSTNNSFKTCLSKKPSLDVEISGIRPLEVTSQHNQCLNNSKVLPNLSIYENFSLPGSPNSIVHRNYNSKSTLKKCKESCKNSCVDLNDQLTDDSQSVMTEDRSQIDFDKALAVVQNKMNELLTSDSRVSDCLIADIKAFNTRRSSASSGVSSNLSGGSIVLANVTEEYKYQDKEEDVVFIEKRLLVSPVVLPVDEVADSNSAEETMLSVASSLPPSVEFDNNTLRTELMQLGFKAGPIQDTTRTLYLKKLQALKKNPTVVQSQGKTYSVELEKSLRSADWMSDLSLYINLESKARADFAAPNKKWREGTAKTSFTYLLLDPRLTDNLPTKSMKQNQHLSWVTFVNSIFYVGKGKRSRPYSHLYQALTLWKRNFTISKDKKVQHILDIWSDKVGVVCLHIFQNVIPAEAYTNEAAMIDVLGLTNLKNLKSGNYYGVASSWPLKERRMLGLYLLYKAMLIFLSEGERQLRPEDID